MVSRSAWRFLPYAALVAAALLIVLLARRLGTLGDEYQRVRVLASTLHSGSVVPTFVAATLDGDSLTIGESADPDTRQLLFILTTTCPYCRATLPVWAQLADSLSRQSKPHIHIVALSLDSVEASRRYADEHHLPFPVVTFPAAKLKRLYRAGTVPQTVVLDREGRVLYARVGVLTEPKVIDSIYLAARLPLAPAASAAAARPAARPNR